MLHCMFATLRCQKEFEKDYMENLDREKYVKDMAAADTEDEKKKLKIEFEQMEMKLRRRSLGNIRLQSSHGWHYLTLSSLLGSSGSCTS